MFFVEIAGIETARFQKCEGLEAETESFEYEEGGGEVHHFQGRTRYPNLVLEKGINDNNEVFNWFQSVTKDEKVERKNGSIVLKNNDNEELKRWNFFRVHYHAVGLDRNSTQKTEVPLLLNELKLRTKELKSIMMLNLLN